MKLNTIGNQINLMTNQMKLMTLNEIYENLVNKYSSLTMTIKKN